MARSVTLHKTSVIGLREFNEDREEYCINLSLKGVENDKYCAADFFIICDGHGGDMVSDYAAPRLLEIMTDNKLSYPLSFTNVVKIFNQVQNEIKNHKQKIGNICGSTVLIVVRYVDKNSKQECIQVINLGDCRCVMNRDGFAIPLTKDHKPSWTEEKNRIRIVNSKRQVKEQIYFDQEDWRIRCLSVSRSLGDLDAVPYITHIPESFNYQLKANDKFIIMACDGLWDVIRSEEAVNFVVDHFTNNNINMYKIPHVYPDPRTADNKNIARKLAEYAIARGSTDNVSILIIFFNK